MSDDVTRTPQDSDAPEAETPSTDAPSPDAAPTVEPAPAPHQARWQARVGVVVVAVVAALALFWPRTEDRTAPPGMLVDDGGRPIPMASRMAPVTLVHFWSTWCPPCIDEVPSILRLAEDYSDNHNFALVMIAVQDDVEKVKTFLGDQVDETLFDHDWKVTHRYGTRKLPETYLVVSGEVAEKFVGATDWGDPMIRRQITDALSDVGGPG